MLDLIIIGAGPAGISAAYEAQKANLNYLVLEKNLIGNTIYQYPVGLTVFSTVNELELQPNTLFPAREKPTREELLSYYTRFVLENKLNIQWEEEVTKVEKLDENHFKITSEKGEYEAANVCSRSARCSIRGVWARRVKICRKCIICSAKLTRMSGKTLWSSAAAIRRAKRLCS